MTKHITRYTKAVFTERVKTLIESAALAAPETETLLNEYCAIVGPGASGDFVRYIRALKQAAERVEQDGEQVDKDSEEYAMLNTLPDPGTIVAEVKAWYAKRKLPCLYGADIVDCPGKLSADALLELVKGMLSDDPTQEQIDQYHAAVVRLGAPQFLKGGKAATPERVVEHIKQWHTVYRNVDFSTGV